MSRPVAWPAAPPYRHLASMWHGGQWSALYAHASSGAVVHGLCSEIVECIRLADATPGEEVDATELRAFLRWARTYEDTLPEEE